MANENLSWDEERIAAESSLKLGFGSHLERADAICLMAWDLDGVLRLSVGRRLFATMRKPYSPAIS
jgi:hypothetical protein